MNKFEIKTDISKALTMPSTFYTDPQSYRKTINNIFSCSWQLVTHTSSLKKKNVYPFTFLNDSLNEPLVITHNNGTLKCLSNVCTHRAHLVCKNETNSSVLRCGYHGRTFDLNGTIKTIPGFEGAKDCPLEKDNLQEIQLKNWNEFIFVSLHSSIKNSPVLEDIEKRLNWFPFDKISYNKKLSKIFYVDAHWALYCENYLEGMHIPYVHKGLAKEIDCTSYITELLENGVVQYGESKNNHDKNYAHYYWIFPNLMLNFYSWGLSINILEPISPEKTRIKFFIYPIQGKNPIKEFQELKQVELEDEAVVSSVQKGIKSQLYSQWRYAPKHEQGVHYLHQLLSQYIR